MEEQKSMEQSLRNEYCAIKQQVETLKAENADIRQNSISYNTHDFLVAIVKKETADDIVKKIRKVLVNYIRHDFDNKVSYYQVGCGELDNALSEIAEDCGVCYDEEN